MFKYHTRNLQSLEFAIKQIQRELRQYISQKNEKAEFTYTRIFSYLLISWTEISLLKLICQRRLFTRNEELEILNCRKLETKWKKCLEIAFRKNFNITGSSLVSQLPFTYRSFYKELKRIIENDFVQSIEVRNRIAHGQWKYAYTNDCLSLSQDIIKNMNLENIITLQMKMKILRTLTSIINDFCISNELAMRDFDIKYRIIDEQVNNLHKRNYSEYKKKMIEKYNRGIEKRNLSKISI